MLEGINVVSFSGGRTSAYLVHLMEQERKKGAEVHYVFMDTGAEHPATYTFIRNIVAFWGIPLVCIRAKFSPVMGEGIGYEVIPVEEIRQDLGPWVAMNTKHGNPSVAAPYCTSKMKTIPHDTYLDDRFGKGNYACWLGIRIDEPNRLAPKKGIRFLAELSDFKKSDILKWWREQPFDLGINEHLGNCVFCIKKSPGKVALAAKDEPEMAARFIEATEGDHVRTEGRKHDHKRMYRGDRHLSDIIEDFKDRDRDELFRSLRSMQAFDTGTCSESCEVFQLGFDWAS